MPLLFNPQRAYVRRNGLSAVIASLTLVLSWPLLAWETQYYNPKPSADDVILPMPCQGSMVFKKIATPTTEPLDDVKVILGSDNRELGFAEYATPNYIAGSFADKGKQRYFLLAKYELTQLQYQAVMSETCPAPALNLLLPVTNISWFDAIAFTNNYNQWLLKNSAADLPKVENELGYVRLPTNSEWEYAARGGSKVSDSEFRDNLFPMPEGHLAQYAWFSGAKSANGKLQVIGRLSPNPLDLYDLLGNASEMMFDAFRLNKLDRYHGQLGALTVRGGSYLTPENQLSTAYRSEKNYYDSSTKAAYRSKDMGMRVLISAALMGSSEQIKALDKAWQALGREDLVSHRGQSVVGEIEKISDKVVDEETKKELNNLQNLVRSANQARDEQRDRSIQAALQLGAFLCANVSDLNGKFLIDENLYKVMTTELCKRDDKEAMASSLCAASKINTLKANLDASRNARDFVLKYYADSIVSGSTTYEQAQFNDQFEKTAFILNNSGKANMGDYLNLYLKHINNYYKTGKVERTNWLAECNSIKEADK